MYKYSGFTKYLYRLSRFEEYALVSSAIGLGLLTCAFLVTNKFPKINCYIKTIATVGGAEVASMQYMPEGIITFVLSGMFVVASRIAVRKSMKDPLNDTKTINLDEIIYRWSLRSRNSALDDFIIDAMAKQTPVEIVLKSRKVYVGLLKSTRGASHINIVPIVSGYRDDTMKLNFTTFYDTKLLESKKKDSNFSFDLYVPTSEIVTYRHFDVKLYMEVFLQDQSEISAQNTSTINSLEQNQMIIGVKP